MLSVMDSAPGREDDGLELAAVLAAPDGLVLPEDAAARVPPPADSAAAPQAPVPVVGVAPPAVRDWNSELIATRNNRQPVVNALDALTTSHPYANNFWMHTNIAGNTVYYAGATPVLAGRFACANAALARSGGAALLLDPEKAQYMANLLLTIWEDLQAGVNPWILG